MFTLQLLNVYIGSLQVGDLSPLSLSLSPSSRQVKQSEELAKEDAKPFEHKDYSLKQGQKIHISLGVSQSF